jgi:hypothetical protein
MSRLWLATPLAFLLGALAGGLLIWHWRGRRGDVAGGLPRGQRWRLVAATALATTLLLAAVSYGLVRHRFQRSRMGGASESAAVADYRRLRGAGGGGGAGRTPPGGVYTYLATGYYQVSAPVVGKERRDLPATVPAVLVAKRDCWELAVRYFAKHVFTSRYCRTPEGGLRLVSSRNQNEAFSVQRDSTTSCADDVILRPGQRAGEKRTLPCRADGPGLGDTLENVAVEATFVGDESLEINGRAHPVRHVRLYIAMKGLQAGSVTQDMWFTADTLLLARLKTDGTGSGMARFRSDYQITLKNLQPTQ